VGDHYGFKRTFVVYLQKHKLMAAALLTVYAAGNGEGIDIANLEVGGK
jgi:hypothetical protein